MTNGAYHLASFAAENEFPTKIPSTFNLFQVFQRNLKLTPNSSLHTIIISFPLPQFFVEIILTIVKRTELF